MDDRTGDTSRPVGPAATSAGGPLQVRTVAADRHGRVLLAVEAGGRTAAEVEVARARRTIEPFDRGRSPAATAALLPDPVAWPVGSAARAAERRWSDAHPAVRTVWQLRTEDPVAHPPAMVLEAIGAHLAGSGVRRLDVRVEAADPLASALRGDRWVQGRLGGDVVASLAVAHPWAVVPDPDGRLARVLAPLPPRVQRIVRRAAAIHPDQVRERVRTAATEVVASVQHRSRPGGPRSTPAVGAPPGSHPFAASRYRTVRSALALVPPALRATTFTDIGCGDGRVLAEALRAGFPAVVGRELDPALAERASAAVGRAGRVEAGDALAAPLPDDVGVVFLNNPFDGTVLGRFAELVAASLERRPRPLLVLYLNPRPIEPLLDAGLVLTEVDPSFSVFASRAVP